MGIKEMAKELKEEIKNTEEKLAKLRQMEAIVSGMQIPLAENVPKSLSDAVPLGRMRRKLKYTPFTEIETRQVINMWNSMKDMPNMNQQTIVSQIGRAIKQPYKRVYNKLYWLKRNGRIKTPQEMFAPKVTATATSARAKAFYWKPSQKQQLAQLVMQEKSPREISEIMGIDSRIISNKLGRMKLSGEIPKTARARTKPVVPRNPLLNL